MGKNVVVVLFIVTCLLSVYVLMTRKNPEDRVLDPDAAKEPRVSMEEFTIYKYRNHQVVSTFSGKLSHFLDPNLLELYGSLRGLRHNSVKREYVSCESSTVYFKANGISELMKDATVTKAELEDNVNVGVSYNRLLTEFAEYLPSEDLLQSELPVTVKGPTGQIQGNNGFSYLLGEEKIKIFGPIKGVLQGAELPKH